MSEWQNIENPPDTDRDVLTYDAVSKKLLVGWHLDGDWFDTLRGDMFDVSHWRDVALPGESPIKICPSCKCPPHDGSCIQAGPLLTWAEQAAPIATNNVSYGDDAGHGNFQSSEKMDSVWTERRVPNETTND